MNRRVSLRIGRWLGVGLVALAVSYWALLNLPGVLFRHHVTEGRLTLYSDRPIDQADARAVLRDVAARLASSPIDDRRPHAVAIANSEWRRRLVFSVQGGAAGVNYYPLTGVVYLRHADIAHDRLFGSSGRPAAPPRTLAYYMAHEIAHSLTAEHLGWRRLWNRSLPQWVREGYADDVGLGGKVDIDDLYRRWRAGDPELSFARSHTYAEFRLPVAVFLQRQGWSVERLLNTTMTTRQAQGAMQASLAKPVTGNGTAIEP